MLPPPQKKKLKNSFMHSCGYYTRVRTNPLVHTNRTSTRLNNLLWSTTYSPLVRILNLNSHYFRVISSTLTYFVKITFLINLIGTHLSMRSPSCTSRLLWKSVYSLIQPGVPLSQMVCQDTS